MQQCRRHWHTWLHVLPSIPIAIVLASPVNRGGLGVLIKHHREAQVGEVTPEPIIDR